MSGSEQAGNPLIEALLPAMEKLDALLGRALHKAEQIYGQQGSADPYRGLYISDEEAAELLKRPPGAPLFATEPQAGVVGGRLEQLGRDFRLEPFDLDLLIVALAPELDLRYERLYAYLQDDVTRKRPSVDLALNLLCQSVADKIERRAHLAPEAPLRRHGLLHLICDSGQICPSLLSCYLKLDDQVVKFLLGLGGLDARVAAYCRLIEPSVELNDLFLPEELKAGLLAMARRTPDGNAACRVYLHGKAGLGKRSLAEAISRRLQRPFLTLDLALVPPLSGEFAASIDLAMREARFLNAVLYIDGFEVLAGEERRANAQHLMTRIGDFLGIVFVGGAAPWTEQGRAASKLLPVAVPSPDFETRFELWRRALRHQSIEVGEPDLIRLANRFLFTPRQIERAAESARKRRLMRFFTESIHQQTPALEDVITGAREQSKPNLGALASGVDAKAKWDDIVLPQDQKTQLLEICNQAEYRYLVYGRWGFDAKLSTGKGLNVLFSGPPGTGKTMAAEVIANRLRLDLLKIDLSQIVSKYIGETEKNVSRVFTEARASNSILFFDEADALFGRRSEVRDAHDRYANVEIAYLLQQMDDYEGISILATNLKQNIDDAFLRRLAFTLEFPFPDESSRRRIWETSWPDDTPRDDEIDFGHLARQFRFSGGSIKNTVLAAAFLAARRGRVGMVDLLIAARRESEKMGRAPARGDYGLWWDQMEERIMVDWAEAQTS